MGALTRRGALGLLAAATTLRWGEQRAVADQRVRPGAPLRMACDGADAFQLAWREGPSSRFPAPDGRLYLPAPAPRAAEGFAELTCTPLRGGEPCGAPATVWVLAERPGFGA